MTHAFDLDAFVKNHDHPLQLVTHITDVQPDERGVTIHAGTKRYRRHFHDRYGTMAELAVEEGLGASATMRLEFCTPEILRFRFSPHAVETLPANETPMVVEDFAQDSFPVAVESGQTSFTLRSEALQVTMQRDPWQLFIVDYTGSSLFETIPAAVFQQPPTGTSTVSGAPSLTDAWPWFFRGVYPLGFVEHPHTGMIQCFESFESRHDEHYYGFGEKYSDLDKRGQSIALWPDNATGNTSPLSYKNIPFFHSSRGYGIFINSAFPIQYHMGDQHHARCSMHVQEGLLDYYFIYGPSYKEILPRYTRITGRPEIPPLWSFGLWMSRMSYRTQEEVEHVAQELRRREIPCDVIHIDTDWYKTPWVSDLRFAEDRFPNPQQMIAGLRELGFRLTLWQLPYIGTASVLYDEGARLGYFAQDDEGHPYHINGFFGPTAVIDYSNPEAVDWIQKEFERLFDMGVAAIKTDFGEGAPTAAQYHAVPGLAMRNLYPLLYNKAVFEVTRKSTGEGIVWGRSTYAGSQRFPVHWGGDPAALWVDLGQIWHGGLGLGLSGLPFWSVDIGGFAGQPSPELFIR
ncbi:MAG: glycoside hydrolase family 31 protein, partial [Candidatus Promineifilaceae bacterium]|nr:glycoside hydrolase family 31 protein [Candidatus Promineifilaceae bacterium]